MAEERVVSSSSRHDRVDVLGVPISAISMGFAVDEISRWIRDRQREYVCVTGVHGVMESQADAELRRIHATSGLTTPDGMPMVWACRYAGVKTTDRVYGPDLMLELCGRAKMQGWSSYFYGGGPGIAEELAKRLRQRFPGLQVAGTYSPPFRPLTVAESDEIVEMINSSGAQIVWVGLSTPKQERWMAEYRGRLDAPVLLGVGAAFDMHAGRLHQAPGWMQGIGLEWAYRLAREPRRLWRRYLTNNPRFMMQVLQNRPRRAPQHG